MSRLLMLALALASTSGCTLLQPSGPTEVARGEYYSAGKPEYDAFFLQLHQLQVDLLTAPDEPNDVRVQLTQAAGLTPDASDDSLRERLNQELKKLAGQGLRVRLDVPEPSDALDASATLHTSDSALSSPLRGTLPQQATRLVRSRNRMLASKEQLQKLAVAAIRLESGIDQVFRIEGPWKRDEVRRNLSDSQKVITLMTARAQEVIDQDQKLLGLLTSTASTDANLGKAPAYTPPPPPTTEPTNKAVKRPAPRGSGGNKPVAKPAPAKAPPSPAPKPAAGGDDAPAPKPVQGNAPAEIEP